jgi:hypothetical protein
LRCRFVPVGPCSRTTSRLCAMARPCQSTPAQPMAYVSFNYFPIQFPPQYWLCSNRQGAFAIGVPTSHVMRWVPRQRHGGWVGVEGRCNASTASRCVASTYAGELWTTSTRLTHVDETKHSIPRRQPQGSTPNQALDRHGSSEKPSLIIDSKQRCHRRRAKSSCASNSRLLKREL